jgi:hypothetical protein
MPVFDQLQRASFDGLDFPVKSVSIKGRYRHEEHEYLRVPGAVIEKLERGLYSIEMQACFDTNVRGYGRLWPDVLAAIRSKYETGITSALVIPTIGTIPAMQPEWDQTAEMGKLRSGEMVRLSFKEDQTQRFLSLALVQTQQQDLATRTANLTILRPPDAPSIFDQILNAANGILAIKDQSDLYGGLLAAKLGMFTALLNEADKQVTSLNDPTNHETLDAFLELWDAAVRMSTNLAESPRGPRTYVTPRQMSVSDIATDIYGSSERANEIMLNNRLDDPFAVRAGTTIIYFETAGLLAA